MAGLDSFKQCRICRGLFQYSGYGPEVCPACKKEDEEMFDRVKTYLRDNPGRTLHQTAKDCDVPESRIRDWLKEERLEYTGKGETGLFCEHCGKPIMSGRLCDECRMSFAKAAGEMRRSIEKPAPERKKIAHDGDRMRFLGKRQ